MTSYARWRVRDGVHRLVHPVVPSRERRQKSGEVTRPLVVLGLHAVVKDTALDEAAPGTNWSINQENRLLQTHNVLVLTIH